MAKLPTIEEMAQNVAEKALDGIEYECKTLREWVKIILATDTNVGTELSTNLAEVGTNCISRQAAIDALRGYLVGKRCPDDGTLTCRLIENEVINKLPPIQPEIVRCKDCKHGVLDDGFPHQYFCVFKGDEWNNADYFCGHAKRREVTT